MCMGHVFPPMFFGLLVPKMKVSNLRIVFVSLHADFVDLARII